jgi:hypothetical protein
LIDKTNETRRRFSHLQISIDEAKQICPAAALPELQLRQLTHGDALECYQLKTVEDLQILYAHSDLNLDEHGAYIITGGPIDMHHRLLRPPFSEWKPFAGFLALGGDTHIVNVTLAGNLESSVWGPVGPAGFIFQEYDNTTVVPGAEVAVAGRALDAAKAAKKRFAQSLQLAAFV